MPVNDFETLTPCGECCTECQKKESGFCKGCIESSGHCEEWKESGACPVYMCACEHNVRFCGICADFPCERLPRLIPWRKNIVEYLSGLAELYTKSAKQAAELDYSE